MEKSKSITIRFNEEQYQKLENEALLEGLEPMAFCRSLIIKRLNNLLLTTQPVEQSAGRGRPRKVDTQENAEHRLDKNQLEDLEKCDGLFENAGMLMAGFFHRDMATGAVKTDYYAREATICKLSDIPKLSRTLNVIIKAKLKPRAQGKSREEVQAEREAESNRLAGLDK